jgi:hypothetical protein
MQACGTDGSRPSTGTHRPRQGTCRDHCLCGGLPRVLPLHSAVRVAWSHGFLLTLVPSSSISLRLFRFRELCALHCATIHFTAAPCTVWPCGVLSCTVLYCTVPCNLVYCTMLYRIAWQAWVNCPASTLSERMTFRKSGTL